MCYSLAVNFRAPFYDLLSKKLDAALGGHHLARPMLYAKKALCFAVSGSGYSRLVFALDAVSPMVYLSKNARKCRGFESPFLDVVKKELPNAFVKSVRRLGHDRVLAFDCLVNDAAYREIERTLVYEGLPKRANLVLLNEDGKILTAYRPSPLDSERPLIRGLSYVPPECPFAEGGPVDPSEFGLYEKQAAEKEREIDSERRRDRYGSLIEEDKRREKLLIRKLSAFDKDEKEALCHIGDGEIGDAFYVGEGLDAEKGILSYEGREYPFDPKEKISTAAERYYRRAKKAKTSLANIKVNREKAERELEQVASRLAVYEDLDEETLEEMLGEPADERKKKKSKSRLVLPRLVAMGALKAYYGHTARENDALTFAFCKNPRFLWFHVKDSTGPHVVIRKETPTEEETEFAACLAVYASGRDEGEVMVALRGDVRKGNVPGQAIVGKYKSLFVKKIPDEYLKAFHEAGVKR